MDFKLYDELDSQSRSFSKKYDLKSYTYWFLGFKSYMIQIPGLINWKILCQELRGSVVSDETIKYSVEVDLEEGYAVKVTAINNDLYFISL